MMEKIKIIDLHFQKTKDAIACFLVETSEGPILIETGPASTFDQLSRGVSKSGYSMEDIHHVLLTHIHFDHAGAAWKLAEAGAKIYVHPFGAPHLASPEKLWNSASQIYGDDMDRLWGKMKPIPNNQLIEVEDGQELEFGNTKVKAIHTPGHAVHHIAWKLGEIIFTGDVAGVKIDGGPVMPPCPPPDIHLEAWKKSLALIKSEKPKELYLTHFGVIDAVDFHLDSLSYMLDDWAEWIKPYYEKNVDQTEVVPLFMEYSNSQFMKEGCSTELIHTYEYANPSWMSVAGLYRYWKLKAQGRLK
jgi:glyoxylase-like metal-dependent hydrolase (beta-lactamase superfamily II)